MRNLRILHHNKPGLLKEVVEVYVDEDAGGVGGEIDDDLVEEVWVVGEMRESTEALIVGDTGDFVFLNFQALFLGNVSFHNDERVIAKQDGGCCCSVCTG